MSVEFDEKPFMPSRPIPMKRTSFVTGLVIKSKIAKSEKDATYVLIGILILAVILAVIASSRTSVEPPVPTAEQIIIS